MPSLSPALPATTRFLSAGPRAGKSALLKRWRSECSAPAQFLALTPEDAEPRLFLRRFLNDWPGIRACYETLEAEHLSSSWGACLGMAIAEAHPDFCLFLDDFHLIEGTALEPGLLASIRLFPASGTLVVSSRHHPPVLGREPLDVWGADHPVWSERPGATELCRLPATLLAKALTLHVVGEAEPSVDGWELVRRNIAWHSPQSLHHLRPAWQDAAELALSHPLPPGLWEGVAMELRRFGQRHLRTVREEEIPAILDRIPPEVRSQTPLFLQLEGDCLLEAGAYSAAQACYARAIALNPAPIDVERGLTLRMIEVALWSRDRATAQEFIGRFQEAEACLPQQVRFLFLKGLERSFFADGMEGAEDLWNRVLSLPASGDRAVLYDQYRALWQLHCMTFESLDISEALHWAQHMVAMATSHHFQRDLLLSHSARTACLMFQAQELSHLPIQELLEVPDEAFLSHSVQDHLSYLCNLGMRFYFLADPDLSVRFFSHYVQAPEAITSTYLAQVLDSWLMRAHGANQDRPKAEIIRNRLHARTRSQRLLFGIEIDWATMLIMAGRYSEAEETLRGWIEKAQIPGDRALALICLLWIRHRQGEASALGEIRSLLDTPDGRPLWESNPRLLQRIGLRTLPPIYRLRALGDLSFTCNDLPAPRWPRRRALLMLAHLVLCPSGLDSDLLIAKLFKECEPVEMGRDRLLRSPRIRRPVSEGPHLGGNRDLGSGGPVLPSGPHAGPRSLVRQPSGGFSRGAGALAGEGPTCPRLPQPVLVEASPPC